ncbi:effector binding domain-containing protein [Hazenella coriacea]|uniref:Putative transcriptional regulator YdeE n=1 Tax=Hazenella coriacea TaxID=1179467 RepID=A0A4R3L2Y2_9BACL|nr:effector binding domain-containing protein [Hazenella coriacea]TCS93839.1 putative transcriptional regulator YdeE [Hazenella coriacea]
MLTIGQMARIFNISTKTLRHYETIGLFSPSKIGDNLYRYYQSNQISVLRNILFLRSLGMGLEQIRELEQSGSMKNPRVIKVHLEGHAERIQQEINRLQNQLDQVLEMMNHITLVGGMYMKPRIVTLEEFTVVGMEYSSITSEGTIGELWDRFIPHEDEIKNRVNPQVSYGVCHFLGDDEFAYVAGFEAPADDLPPGMISKQIPTQKYAVFTHVGSVDQISKTFEKVFEFWLPQNQLEPVRGIDLEVYDERFLGPFHEQSEVDLYIPIR